MSQDSLHLAQTHFKQTHFKQTAHHSPLPIIPMYLILCPGLADPINSSTQALALNQLKQSRNQQGT